MQRLAWVIGEAGEVQKSEMGRMRMEELAEGAPQKTAEKSDEDG